MDSQKLFLDVAFKVFINSSNRQKIVGSGWQILLRLDQSPLMMGMYPMDLIQFAFDST